MQLSVPVRALLDDYLGFFGEVLISEEDAARLYLGTSESLVKDLGDEELLQLALCAAVDSLRNQGHELTRMRVNAQVTTGMNRAARRHR